MHWLTNLSDYYFRSKILRRKVPLLASFKITYKCNLYCKPCPFHTRANQEKSTIGWSEAVQVLEKLYREGCRILVFEGGEPLLWQDGKHNFSDLVNLAKKFFLKVAVTTNGTLPLDVPADLVWVSLDGLKKTHDMLRSNSFDSVWNNIQSSCISKLLVHFTINRINMLEIEEFLLMLKNAPAVRGVTFQLFYPYGQGEEDMSLTQEEKRTALQKVIYLKQKGFPIFNSINSLKSMLSKKWRCDESILINVDPDGTITKGCYAKNRGEIKCSECGFTPVAEATGALRLQPGSIRAGWKIFLAK